MSVVDLFVQLAAIPSPSREERAVAERVAHELERLGLAVEAELVGGHDGSPNLLCRLPATAEGTPLLFCAHLDTAPPDGPVEPVVERGVVRNRAGTILGADDKAAVAVLVEAARALVRERRPHPGIELLFTCQEEIGLQGAKAVRPEALRARAGFVFDDEGPVGRVVAGAPFQENVLATFRGRAAHAGVAPEEGRSAIVAAARAIAVLPNGRVDPDTTANVGVIRGGVARNLVPDACNVEADVRSFDGGRAREVVEGMLSACARAAQAAGCTVEADVFEGYPGYVLDAESVPVALARAALAECGRTAQLVRSGGGSDANVLNARGVPTVNLANGMRRIHTRDEHVAVADLEAMVRVTLAIADLARGGEPQASLRTAARRLRSAVPQRLDSRVASPRPTTLADEEES